MCRVPQRTSLLRLPGRQIQRSAGTSMSGPVHSPARSPARGGREDREAAGSTAAIRSGHPPVSAATRAEQRLLLRVPPRLALALAEAGQWPPHLYRSSLPERVPWRLWPRAWNQGLCGQQRPQVPWRFRLVLPAVQANEWQRAYPALAQLQSTPRDWLPKAAAALALAGLDGRGRHPP